MGQSQGAVPGAVPGGQCSEPLQLPALPQRQLPEAGTVGTQEDALAPGVAQAVPLVSLAPSAALAAHPAGLGATPADG